MRAALLLVLLSSAACRPDIGFGAYACGPNATCPTDQKCDEAMDLCVDPPTAESFVCDGAEEMEPDDNLLDATVIGGLTCVSSPVTFAACLGSGDALDLFTFSTPSTCTTVSLEATLTYKSAYEELTVTLVGSDGTTVVANDVACPSGGPTDDGVLAHCVTAPLAGGSAYALRVETTGSGDCGGQCPFNRYNLTVQLLQ
jgi:hypothetical protein